MLSRVDSANCAVRFAHGFYLLSIATLTFAPMARAGNIFDEGSAPPSATPIRRVLSAWGPTEVETTQPTRQTGAAGLPAAPLPTGQITKRLPVPDKESLDKSRKLFKQFFAAELLDRSPDARRKLGERLIEESKKSSDASTDQYLLLIGASQAAREGLDLDVASRAVDALSMIFAIDGLRMKVAAAISILSARGPVPFSDATCTSALKLIDELLQDEDFASAAKVLSLVRPAITAAHPYLVPMLNRRAKELDASHSASERAMPLAEKLKASPDDPAANYVVGTFLCFYRQDWLRGLPMLAKCSDAHLKSLASSELASPRESDAIAQIADRWWSLAETYSEPARQHLLNHAATLYKLSLIGSIGLRRSVIQKRLDDVARAARVDQPGVIDLMPMIDVSRDTIAGVWKMEGGHLFSDAGSPARIRIQFRPPEEYDFRIVFARLEGNHDIAQLLSHGKFNFTWAMGTSENKCAFLDEHKVWFDKLFTNGVTSESIVKVRKDSIATYIDGKLALELKTDYTDLHGAWPGAEGMLGVATWQSPTRFDTIEVVEVTGHGLPLKR